jgi:hypothetical protein
LEEVVVVHEACLDLAGRDALQDSEVVLVHLWIVSLYPFEPLAGYFFALDKPEGGDECLERAVGRGPAESTLPFGVRELEYGVREILLAQSLRIVRYDPRPARDADPSAVRVAEPLLYSLQDLPGQRAQKLPVGYGSQRPGVLGEKDVRGTVRALFQDGRGELRRVPVANLDVYAALLLEPLDDRAYQLLVAPGVHDQRTLSRDGLSA